MAGPLAAGSLAQDPPIVAVRAALPMRGIPIGGMARRAPRRRVVVNPGSRANGPGDGRHPRSVDMDESTGRIPAAKGGAALSEDPLPRLEVAS